MDAPPVHEETSWAVGNFDAFTDHFATASLDPLSTNIFDSQPFNIDDSSQDQQQLPVVGQTIAPDYNIVDHVSSNNCWNTFVTPRYPGHMDILSNVNLSAASWPVVSSVEASSAYVPSSTSAMLHEYPSQHGLFGAASFQPAYDFSSPVLDLHEDATYPNTIEFPASNFDTICTQGLSVDLTGSFTPARSVEPTPSRDQASVADESESDASDTCYAQLLFRCLKEAPDHMLPLKELYSWIHKNSAKAKDPNNTGWKNSVRHNLSMNAVSLSLPFPPPPPLTPTGFRKSPHCPRRRQKRQHVAPDRPGSERRQRPVHHPLSERSQEALSQDWRASTKQSHVRCQRRSGYPSHCKPSSSNSPPHHPCRISSFQFGTGPPSGTLSSHQRAAVAIGSDSTTPTTPRSLPQGAKGLALLHLGHVSYFLLQPFAAGGRELWTSAVSQIHAPLPRYRLS